MKYLLWPAVLLVTACVYVYFARSVPGTIPAPIHPTRTQARTCRQLSTGPTVKLCSDGRGYIVQDGKWSDIGPATPLPGVPAR